jgi:hypothetical protein
LIVAITRARPLSRSAPAPDSQPRTAGMRRPQSTRFWSHTPSCTSCPWERANCRCCGSVQSRLPRRRGPVVSDIGPSDRREERWQLGLCCGTAANRMLDPSSHVPSHVPSHGRLGCDKRPPVLFQRPASVGPPLNCQSDRCARVWGLQRPDSEHPQHRVRVEQHRLRFATTRRQGATPGARLRLPLLSVFSPTSSV